MSVQFGRWNFEGQPPALDYTEKVSAALAPYGPDSNEYYAKGGIIILYRAFHTTKESRRETQPHISPSGTVITWDGRLDNRAELINELGDSLSIDSADVSIVAAAYEKRGVKCLGKLIGDWALSIWNPRERSVLLAKDPIGTKHIYYSVENNQVTWSTLLDPLILLAGKQFAICEEYVAGWLSQFPATHLTPYVGIHGVPPATFVLLDPGEHIVNKCFWDFDAGQQIRYRTDREYEEHFRSVFAQSVQRRLRSDTPILAELSGGRDSSSVVCMADAIIANGAPDTSSLGTVSYYDDSEPNCNERFYFTKVEEKRGKTGLHINIGPDQQTSAPACKSYGDGSILTPSYSRRIPEFGNWLTSRGNRVVLSGIGGDEVMGGVPIPTPEIQDLIATAQLRSLARQLKAWALQKRKPWFLLLFEAARGFFPPALFGISECARPAQWLQAKFVKRHLAALTGYPSRVKLFGPRASFQDNLRTLNCLRRQLACQALSSDPIYEMRYPYLDRDLLEFMYAIPREQSVRPTQRRSLMRRALADLVPGEILNRKGKGLAMRAPLVRIRNDWTNLVRMNQQMLSSLFGFVDPVLFMAALQKGRRGEVVPIVSIIRMTLFERWLRDVRALGIVDADISERLQMTLLGSRQVGRNRTQRNHYEQSPTGEIGGSEL